MHRNPSMRHAVLPCCESMNSMQAETCWKALHGNSSCAAPCHSCTFSVYVNESTEQNASLEWCKDACSARCRHRYCAGLYLQFLSQICLCGCLLLLMSLLACCHTLSVPALSCLSCVVVFAAAASCKEQGWLQEARTIL